MNINKLALVLFLMLNACSFTEYSQDEQDVLVYNSLPHIQACHIRSENEEKLDTNLLRCYKKFNSLLTENITEAKAWFAFWNDTTVDAVKTNNRTPGRILLNVVTVNDSLNVQGFISSYGDYVDTIVTTSSGKTHNIICEIRPLLLCHIANIPTVKKILTTNRVPIRPYMMRLKTYEDK